MAAGGPPGISATNWEFSAFGVPNSIAYYIAGPQRISRKFAYSQFEADSLQYRKEQKWRGNAPIGATFLIDIR